ncbi:hypothetical protein HAX54_028283 [Datura stramonium]|uniref:Uncharacterized protein n=1 Tax=Datura stramonium TaxID=4076 RepID=A0ABS8V6P5_DATST|nr:hypothetical protein [Datura stramonium]
MTGRPMNVEVTIKDVLRRARVKKGEDSTAFCRVGLDFEYPFYDDDATDNEQAHVDSNLESDADEGDDSKMEKVVYAPIDDND